MAFHVPFNQRASARRRHQPQPIYIGFDVPQPRPPRPAFNWWGFNGMWMSFASLLSAGFLSPVPLLISLVGLRRPGKKMATVGTLTSLAGVALAVTIAVGSTMAHRQHVSARQAAHYNRVVKKQIIETEKMLVVAGDEIVEYRDDTNGELPSDIDGCMLVIKHVDPWGKSLRFELEKDHGVLRSAGPDQDFDTKDDIAVKIEGEVIDAEPLLPLDE